MCGILLIAELTKESSEQCEHAHPAAGCEPAVGGGTCCRVGTTVAAAPAAAAALLPAAFSPGLSRRGPDADGAYTTFIPSTRCHLTLGASLLQLRGAERLTPPLVAPSSGAILCFNGEIFDGLDVGCGANDGARLLEALESTPAAGIAGLLSRLRGPWALLYWRPEEQRLWFGRDWLGRRSLLVRPPTSGDPSLILSSTVPLSSVSHLLCSNGSNPGKDASGGGGSTAGAVATALAAAADWVELEPGLYSITGQDLARQLVAATEAQNAQQKAAANAALEAAGADDSHTQQHDSSGGEGSGCSRADGGASGWPWLCVQRHSWECPELLCLLQYQRPPALVQPSSDDCLPSSRGEQAAQQLRAAGEQVLAALRAAVRARCDAIDDSCGVQEAGQGKAAPDRLPWEPPAPAPLLPPAPVMILFSGGCDSTLLAALASEALPAGTPIDLVSICFDNGRSPDRLGARDALLELSSLAPTRPWRLIEADCTLADADAARAHLLSLLAPAATVMDLNIGAALWLAARGEGRVVTPQRVMEQQQAGQQQQAGEQRPGGKQPQAGLNSCGDDGGGTPSSSSSSSSRSESGAVFRSCARVVFTGHGADEQAAGYGRHRTCFNRGGGWAALGRELASDVSRLWIRNLGRDDRLIADRGREARHPFLGEEVVGALLGVPLWLLFHPGLPLGHGDKAALREALRLVGLPRTAARVKRALQFGSRIAKHANVRDFGSGHKANSANAGSVPLAALALQA